MRRYLGFAATALLVSQVSAGVNHAVIAEGVAGANDADVKQHDTKSDFQRAIDEKIGLLRGTAEALNAMPSSPPSEKATSAPHSLGLARIPCNQALRYRCLRSSTMPILSVRTTK
jgi:hypothetical protein